MGFLRELFNCFSNCSELFNIIKGVYDSASVPHLKFMELSNDRATACKPVRPKLSDSRPVCPVLSCLSVTLVYCGQTVLWIKMKLSTEVGLDAGHIVSDGDPAPSRKRGTTPTFRPVYCGQTTGWINMPLGTEVDLDRGRVVLDGDPASSSESSTAAPLFSAHVCCGQTVTHLSYCRALVELELVVRNSNLFSITVIIT